MADMSWASAYPTTDAVSGYTGDIILEPGDAERYEQFLQEQADREFGFGVHIVRESGVKEL